MLRRKEKIKKIFKKTPGARVAKRYKRKKTAKANCAICKRRLQGVLTDKVLAKSRKRSGRKFAGMLCHQCAVRVLKVRTRIKNNSLKIEDVEIKYRPYL